MARLPFSLKAADGHRRDGRRPGVRGVFCAAWMLLVCIAACALAQGAEEDDSFPSAFTESRRLSRTQRFLVTGAPSADAVYLASWAEDVAEAVADTIGSGIFFRRGEPLHLAVRTDEQDPAGRVVRAQGYIDRRLRQKLILVNGDLVDQEEALEGLCWLLLNRYVIARQDGSQRAARLGTVPYGLAVGLAQHLYPHLRRRNSELVIRMWSEGLDLPFRRALLLEELGRGERADRALAGLALAWMTSWEERGPGWPALFGHLAAGGELTGEWMALHMAGLESERALRQDWDLWLASRVMVDSEWGTAGWQDAARLRSLLTVGPEVLSLAARREVMEVMELEDLIARRDEPWIPDLATFLALRIQGLGIGRSGEFQAVTAKYADFLRELGRRPPAGLLARWFYRPATEHDLREQLNRAREALEELEAGLGG